MIFCTYPNFTNESPKLVYLQSNFIHNYLIFLITKNSSFSTKLHPNNLLFTSAENIENPRDNGRQPILVSKIGIIL